MRSIIGVVFGAAGVVVMTHALHRFMQTGDLVIAGQPVRFIVDPGGGVTGFGMAAGFVGLLIAASAVMVHCGAYAMASRIGKRRSLSGRI